jgi:ribonuclease E
MANKMLIDAAHPEETRVVVLRGNRVEEFDFEAANKKPLRGNIYLAKVTRVEPSLQAAFVDYGGNRHGFLAFSEIHPDYYQIPVSDRQALIEEFAAAHRDEEDEERPQRRSRRWRGKDGERAEKRRHNTDDATIVSKETDIETEGEVYAPDSEGETADGFEPVAEAPVPSDEMQPLHHAEATDDAAPDEASVEEIPASLLRPTPVPEATPETDSDEAEETDAPHAAEDAATPHLIGSDPEGFAVVEDVDAVNEAGEAAIAAHDEETEARFRPSRRSDEDEDGEEEEADQVEQLGGDAMEEMPMRSHRSRRQYKIQEVIKRRQILLVQVVKEERGNKGAALTTYLSLAGRYSVLMPNTARGGGISRKITDAGDRQRLKSIAQELEVPEGMGVILRTAGASRTKAEVKRDFEYLLRMWETVRELTLKSTAPNLVYEEGSLVKRAIRDLYNKDIDEVMVSGDTAYREAKEFMRMLMPSHAKNVQPYRDPHPIFAKSGVEAQLDAMFSNHVSLKSGGYLVINQTEALVAIDVNSGRSTREHNIEDTALRTNLEAADEIARQLRLRDLAGLIVVDFIDMEEGRNNRSVERRMKEALKNDRARIQIGRISHFGLLEMSRQRIRTGVLEGSTAPCPHCAGAGMVRSTASIALHVLRVLEDALIKSSAHNITVRTRSEVALYILNQKRGNLRDLEQRFGVSVTIVGDDTLTGTAYHAMERGEPATGIIEQIVRQDVPRALEAPQIDDEVYEDEEDEESEAEASGEESEQGDGRRKRRRRRRRGRDRGDREATGINANAPQPSDDALAAVAQFGGFPERQGEDEASEGASAERGENGQRREGGRRRRSRRRGQGSYEGGRQNAGETGTLEGAMEGGDWPADSEVDSLGGNLGAEAAAEYRETVATNLEPHVPSHTSEPSAPSEPVSHAAEAKVTAEATRATPAAEPVAEAPAPEPVSTPVDPNRPKRTGWWQRAKASIGG